MLRYVDGACERVMPDRPADEPRRRTQIFDHIFSLQVPEESAVHAVGASCYAEVVYGDRYEY